MSRQTDIAEQIIKQKADYILDIKEYQKELYQDIESAFLIPSNDKSITYTTEEVGSRRKKKNLYGHR